MAASIWISCLLIGLAQTAADNIGDDALETSLRKIKRSPTPAEPEQKEESLAYLPHSEQLNQDVTNKRDSAPIIYKAMRGSVEAVKEFTVYHKNGTGETIGVEELCEYGHRYLRKKHKTAALKYSKTIAEEAEKYAMKLARSGAFEHDSTIQGKYGENLYRHSNTYDMIANPGHANYAWYEECWQPIPPGKRQDYDYSYDPKKVADFKDSGVGHFTQMMWKDSSQLGCGVATATFKKEKRIWRRTLIVARYRNPGNILARFTQNVKPLDVKDGAATLEDTLKRVKLYPRKARCFNALDIDHCKRWKSYGWCDRRWAQTDCTCTCG